MIITQILSIIFCVSLGGAVFLFLKNLGSLPEVQPIEIPKEKKLSFRFKKNISSFFHYISESLKIGYEKQLRRFRIFIFKIETGISKRIDKLRLERKKRTLSQSQKKTKKDATRKRKQK
ncbi:MAG: hypothetical protein PHO31_01415 [Candidatus Pacebacteria bacterium]|nr:hypothetical protein [Candidatus Paceibacterota bacterium]